MKKLALILIVAVMAAQCKKEEPCEINPNWVDIKVNEIHFACNACEVSFRNNGDIFGSVKFYSDGEKEPKKLIYSYNGLMPDIKTLKIEKGNYYRLECTENGMMKKRDI